jgi:hypothetical protein
MRGCKSPAWVFLATALFGLLPARLSADEPLRWRFQPGQQLRYSIVQEFTITGGEDSAAQNTTRQQIDFTWQVERVGEQGEAVIRHKFERIRSKMSLPVGGLEYDSAEEGPPSGMSAVNAPLYAALVKAPVEITVSSLGQLLHVKLSEEVQAALKRIPTAATMGDFSKPVIFQNLFLTGFPLLRGGESLSPGDSWSVPVVVETSVAGELMIGSVYRYDGLREIDGKNLAILKPTRVVYFDASASARSVKEQSSSGEILWDPAGRLHQSTLKHRVSVNVKMSGTGGDVEQTMDQSIEVKLRPDRS